jgi:hypothetical protein
MRTAMLMVMIGGRISCSRNGTQQHDAKEEVANNTSSRKETPLQGKSKRTIGTGQQQHAQECQKR